ncbi:alpha/beta hydrolase [Aestuariicoccus sp. MJ-SS9]|uniref:alpha/beta hydrolase n=1 Tax=Aestuariicoccus sp. MJ-SS9 TaxID=3079855 RepID=UPI00290F9F9C|nr:alpha/beta fold hydrolase [Aestuariicoccus sp. MJ-SS9]MDU8910167.1 alpha/beta fold hydrolase [Aestuariicoccus sp. MJ-SS9]
MTRSLTLVALLVAGWALWVLEGARAGLTITDMRIGPTPVTHYHGDGPPVVIAHGFAGSRQMMQGYATVLARAGYDVYAFDFEGHGRNRVPMSGDVTRIDGTTRLLTDQTLAVIGAMPGEGPVALLGHSMATDILVRAAAETPRAGPLVLLSAFSEAITPTHPGNLLLITGAWEPGLREFASAALRMVDPAAVLGDTAAAGPVTRRALLAPAAEHVAILHSRPARTAALEWLNAFYGRSQSAPVPPTGWALLALLAAITALAIPLMRLLPASAAPETPLAPRAFALVTLVPAAAAPLLAAPVDSRLLPVLVADYLALHLALFGGLQLALLWRLRGRPAAPALRGFALLLVWALGVFGVALDRYGANFWPTPERLTVIAALCLGAVPFMLADAWLARSAPLWQRIAARLAFLASLAGAIALDFEGLFFLLMIAPVIVLFYVTFGVMGRAAARRSGFAGPGLALGLVLAWALGVSFPLFAA